MPYYAVREGYNSGVYTSWDRAKREVDGYSGPKFKKFKTLEEAKYYYETGRVMEKSTTIKVSKARRISMTRIRRSPAPKRRSKTRRVSRSPVRNTKRIVSIHELLSPGSSSKEPKTKLPTRPKEVHSDVLEVFTDGSASNNGKANCRASYAVYFGESDPRNESGRIKYKPSNQRGELKAIERAISIIIDTLKKHTKGSTKKAIIYTDSAYSINCITKWIMSWKRNGWKTSKGETVKNGDIIKKADQLMQKAKTEGINIQLVHVRAHRSEPKNRGTKQWKLWYGNKKVDQMAQRLT